MNASDKREKTKATITIEVHYSQLIWNLAMANTTGKNKFLLKICSTLDDEQ